LDVSRQLVWQFGYRQPASASDDVELDDAYGSLNCRLASTFASDFQGESAEVERKLET
jgi:hypothetical protein